MKFCQLISPVSLVESFSVKEERKSKISEYASQCAFPSLSLSTDFCSLTFSPWN